MLHEAENWPLVLKDLNIFEARYFEATANGFCFCNFVAASIMRGFKNFRKWHKSFENKSLTDLIKVWWLVCVGCVQCNIVRVQSSQCIPWYSLLLSCPRSRRVYSPQVWGATKSIILPPFCATSVLVRVKSYLFVENISSDYIRKENESITFVHTNHYSFPKF